MTPTPPLHFPTTPRFVLANARVPAGMVQGLSPDAQLDEEGSARLDLLIDEGRIAAIYSAHTAPQGIPQLDLDGRQVWPCFVDMHTHLEKGHVIPRIRPDGTIQGGAAQTVKDYPRWNAQEMALRMEFGIQCAHVHGVSAIRTHLDSGTLAQSKLCFSVFDQKRSEWSGRVDLQAVAISGINVYLSQQGKELADLAAKYGGLLGGATDTLSREVNGTHQELDRALDRMFELAGERGLDVDLHVDQTEDLSAFTIPNIARSKLKTGFKGRVVCGHCVNLSLQPPEVIDSTLALAREADLAFVSMPTPMMYLMDRKKDRTPRWRGVTAAKEILAAGVPLAVGSDNCRDAWFPYGDHDMLDTLKQGIRVFQSDEPLTGALEMSNRVPAEIIGRPDLGKVATGLPANLVIFSARTVNVVLCRDQADRIVLKHGRQVTDKLPLHHELAQALGMREAQ